MQSRIALALAIALFLVAAPTLAYEANGSTLIYNNSLDIEVRDLLSSNPFIFINVPTTLRYQYYYNITLLEMDSAEITIAGNAYNLTNNIFEDQYQIQIVFNSSEIGDYPYTVNGTLAGFNAPRRDAVYYVRDYTTANFYVYTTKNRSTMYQDKFATIIAIPRAMTEAEIYTEIVTPLTALQDWTSLRLGIGDTDKLFKSSTPVFHAPYKESGTTLYLPKNQTYTYRIVSGDHEFTNDYYGYMYYKRQNFDIYLTQDHIINATTYHIIVSKWDTDFMGSFITFIIWTIAVLLIFGIPALVYAKTGDPTLLAKAVIASLFVLPSLALIMSWIVNWAV